VCELCKGCGELHCYTGKVTRTEPIEDFVINCQDNSIPLMVLCKGKGTVIVEQTRKKLEAINHYPDAAVHKNSKELLERHEFRLRQNSSWDLVNQVGLCWSLFLFTKSLSILNILRLTSWLLYRFCHLQHCVKKSE
jgi:hypothetical protein